MKKAFLLYADYFDYFQTLTDEELGRVIRAIFAYQRTGELPSFDDRALKLVFDLIRNQIDRDFDKWRASAEKRKAAAQKRWSAKNQNRAAEEAPEDNTTEEVEEVPTVETALKEQTEAQENPTEEKKTPSKRFQKPTVSEVAEYVMQNSFDFAPQQFFDYYESKGWRVGNAPMKDWHAAARLWQQRAANYAPPQRSPPTMAADKNMNIQELADYFGVQTGAELCKH